MTDIISREGVKTSTVEEVLQTPHDPAMTDQVRRFGFEYEILPSGYYGQPVFRPDDDDEWEDDEDDESQCDCINCVALRRNNTRQSPEVHGTPSELIERAYAAGLTSRNEQHPYHCHCSGCAHDRDHPLMTAQEDGSCGVEFVSRIIDLNDFESASDQIGRWVELFEQWKRDGHWMPDGQASNGNHVHVSSLGDQIHWGPCEARQRAFRHIDALYAVFCWNQVADGGCGQIRSYNAKPSTHGGGSWLSDRGYGTFEHRLWNTPRDPERLWGHLGLSIALTRWAFAIAFAHPEFTFWGTHGTWGYDRNMSDSVYHAVQAGIGDVVEGVSSYIPPEPQFEVARDLILKLR